MWDEANRIKAVMVGGGAKIQHNIYDANGERVLKSLGYPTAIAMNGETAHASYVFGMGNYTTYASGDFVVDGHKQVSKHYFMGGERIASRLVGEFVQMKDECPSLNFEIETWINAIQGIQHEDISRTMQHFGIEYELNNEEPHTKTCEGGDDEINKQCECFYENNCADVLYYYHSNHTVSRFSVIGSGTFLTDVLGIPYETPLIDCQAQRKVNIGVRSGHNFMHSESATLKITDEFMLYLPFGEAMAHQKIAGWGTPYTFTGKEQDAATGLHYFGARYLDTRLSIWFGVDPLADSPNNNYMTPYHYVANNPINNIDPDGLDWYRGQDGNTVWFDSADDTYTDGDGNEFNRIGEYYIMEGKNGYLIHRQNELIAQVDNVSEGIAGQGIDGENLLHSGDFYYSKQELFEWGYGNNDINNYIFNKAPLEIQKEYFNYSYHRGMGEAFVPFALAITFPVALIVGAEMAVGAGVASQAIGPLRNWVRFGVSRHEGSRYFSMRWGAGREKYLREIGSKRLQELNKWLRKQGGGHMDWWKLK